MGGDGIFAKFQPRYAELGIATFPVKIVGKDKIPAITNYQRVGHRASAQLVTRFGHTNAIGCMLGPRSGKTILDVDYRGDAALSDALAEHGDTPYIVRTISGGHHLYYRYGGEQRQIRPWGYDVRKDVLGGGFTVLPPSIGAKGSQYEIIRGTLDDLANLPPLHAVLDSLRQGPIPQGVRNTTVFRRLLREVRHCDDFDSLLDVARSLNMDCIPQQTDATLVKTAKKVWEYETGGVNWVGRKARASTDREEILSLSRRPGALMLLQLLRVSFPGDAAFPIDQVKTADLLRWARQTLINRIDDLLDAGHLVVARPGKGLGNPTLYQLRRLK